MTTKELRAAFEQAEINPCAYCLEGGSPGEAYTMGQEADGRGVTYYSERGLRRNL